MTVKIDLIVKQLIQIENGKVIRFDVKCQKPLKQHKCNENCIWNPSVWDCESDYTKLVVNDYK